MAFVRNWLHCVWGTKNREHLLTTQNKRIIFDHIHKNAEAKGIYIDFINGHQDHVHCTISLGPEQSIAKVMNLIKGESSYWINKQDMIDAKFEWADEYYAVSVSESQMDRVREYIKNQEIHHRNKTWEDECEEFMLRYQL